MPSGAPLVDEIKSQLPRVDLHGQLYPGTEGWLRTVPKTPLERRRRAVDSNAGIAVFSVVENHIVSAIHSPGLCAGTTVSVTVVGA